MKRSFTVFNKDISQQISFRIEKKDMEKAFAKITFEDPVVICWEEKKVFPLNMLKEVSLWQKSETNQAE